MKRFLAILLAIFMMLTVFASCNKGDAVPNETEQPTDGETTIDESTADGTDAPADGTDAPADGTDKPADGTDAPAGETDKPAGETDKPADGTDTPSSGDTGNTTTKGTAPVLNGTKITFGSFPKTMVTDATLINTIKSKGNSEEVDGKTYKTVEHEGKKYLGILENSNDTGTWFEFAPLTWTVLTQSNGEYLVLCDEIIYAMPYDADSNAYENSDIRSWINGWFVKTAFATNQYSYIVTKTVDNTSASTGYPAVSGNNTEDRVFLLARGVKENETGIKEVKNADYGFNTDGAVADTARQKYATEYAIYNGAYVDGNNGAWWWLRTPYKADNKVHRIAVDGTMGTSDTTTPTGGVLPAMWIKLQ